jgi:hypothetical protein
MTALLANRVMRKSKMLASVTYDVRGQFAHRAANVEKLVCECPFLTAAIWLS